MSTTLSAPVSSAPREHVVGRHELGKAEVMGRKTARIELTGRHETAQHRRGVGVNEARRDRDISSPKRLEVQGGRRAVDADVGDVSAGADQLGG